MIGPTFSQQPHGRRDGSLFGRKIGLVGLRVKWMPSSDQAWQIASRRAFPYVW